MDIFIQWLIANSLKGAVLIIAILLVQFIFSKQIPPKWKYLMWLLVAARLIMPSLLELDTSIFNLKNIWQSETINYAQSTIAQQGEVARIVQDQKQFASIDIFAFCKSIELSSILFFIWAAVSIFLFLYLFWKNIRILALVRKEKPIIKSKWLELLENCKQELKLYTPVQLVETRHIRTPTLMGFIRPRILLPEGILNAMTESEIRLIFMHELTHLKCGDIIINWTMSLIQIMHWFNPFVWIAFDKAREARELACDDDMLSILGQNNSKKYGHTIIKLLDLCSNENSITGMVGILENKKQTIRRIEMINNRNQKTRKAVVFTAILLSIMGIVFLSEAKEKENTIASKKEINNVSLSKKIKSIIIPSFNFESVTVKTAVKHLQEQSKQLDPEKKGVNIFIINPELDKTKIDVSGRKVSLEKAIRMFCKSAGARYIITREGVAIKLKKGL